LTGLSWIGLGALRKAAADARPVLDNAQSGQPNGGQPNGGQPNGGKPNGRQPNGGQQGRLPKLVSQ